MYLLYSIEKYMYANINNNSIVNFFYEKYNNKCYMSVKSHYDVSNSSFFNNSCVPSSYVTFSDSIILQLVQSSSIFINNVLVVSAYIQLLIFFMVLISSFFVTSRSFLFFKKLNGWQYKETLSYQDSIFFLFFFLFGIFNIFFYSFKVLNSFGFGYFLIIVNIFFLLSIIVQIPVFFFINNGIFIITNIKGSLKRENLFIVLIEDSSSVLTYLIRYFLQSIRWLLVLTSSFLINENFYETFSIFNLFSNVSNSIYDSFTFKQMLVSLVKGSLEYLDLLFMISVQLGIFCVLLFWLLSFLFSTNIKNIFEK